MTHLYLIRHGSYIEDERQPNPDPALSPDGVAQVERLRERLAATGEIVADALISSTLARARQTAAIIAPALGLPVTLDPDVAEWRNEHKSLKPDDFMTAFRAQPLDQRPFYVPFPGGETWAAFMLRACTALNRIAHHQAGKTVVIVCHGGIIQASFLYFFGSSTLHVPTSALDAGYTSITHWEKMVVNGNDRWLLERHNDTAHLQAWADFGKD